ncbi:hypothetical protein GCM10023347_08010 [Streptomyces chumphonensis]
MAPDHSDGSGIVTASAQPPCCAALEEALSTSAHDAADRLLVKAGFLPIGTSDRHTDDETAVASELYVLEISDTGSVATRKGVAGTGEIAFGDSADELGRCRQNRSSRRRVLLTQPRPVGGTARSRCRGVEQACRGRCPPWWVESRRRKALS